MARFLYQIVPARPAMVSAATPLEAQVIDAHYAYLRQNAAAGPVLLAGRTQTDDSFGIVIIEAATEADARAFMEADPAVREGVMRAELFPYRVAIGGTITEG